MQKSEHAAKEQKERRLRPKLLQRGKAVLDKISCENSAENDKHSVQKDKHRSVPRKEERGRSRLGIKAKQEKKNKRKNKQNPGSHELFFSVLHLFLERVPLAFGLAQLLTSALGARFLLNIAHTLFKKSLRFLFHVCAVNRVKKSFSLFDLERIGNAFSALTRRLFFKDSLV